jgi:hypothetical protein
MRINSYLLSTVVFEVERFEVEIIKDFPWLA